MSRRARKRTTTRTTRDDAGPGAPSSSRAQPQGPSVFRFVIGFVLYLAIANALLLVTAVDSGFVKPWTRANVRAAAAIGSWLGWEAQAQGTTLLCGSFPLDVLEGCNGVMALSILLAAVLAYPCPWRRRVLGAASGVVIVLGANLARLVSFIAVVDYRPALLEFFHIYVWQTLMGLLIFAAFVSWGVLVATRPVRSAR